MLGYKLEEVEDMMKTLNYSLHHYLPNVTGSTARFVEEDTVILRKLYDLLDGLIMEGHIQ